MNLARRGLLRLITAAPAVAAALPAMGVHAAGYGVAGLGAAAASFGNNTVPHPAGKGPIRFMDFAKWLKERGEKDMREDARHVSMVDADIASLHLPLATKVRFQRERNYQRILENRKTWFERQLENSGFVEIW